LETLLADLEERDNQLTAKSREVADASARIEAQRDGLDQLQSELGQRAAELDEKARDIELNGRAEARRFLLDARKRVEEALGVARAAVSEATAKEARRLVEDGARNERDALKRLEREARKKGWTIKGSGYEKEQKQETSDGVSRVKVKTPATLNVANRVAQTEVDLRGMTADEAEDALLRALDDAVVADLGAVRIIHGKGTGALRERVSQVLSHDTRVVSFHNAPPHQGGWGVTIVEFEA
jgi:DNA mismatch repair protein MutS2